MRTPSSDTSCALTSTPACAWASELLRPALTPSGRSYGAPDMRLLGFERVNLPKKAIEDVRGTIRPMRRLIFDCADVLRDWGITSLGDWGIWNRRGSIATHPFRIGQKRRQGPSC